MVIQVGTSTCQANMYNSLTATLFLSEVSRSGLQQALRACEVAAQWPLALHLVNHGHGGGGYGMAALVAGGVLQYSSGWCGFSSGIDVWNMLIQSWTEIATYLCLQHTVWHCLTCCGHFRRPFFLFST